MIWMNMWPMLILMETQKQNPLYHNVRKKPTTATITVNIPYICIIVCLSINLSTIKTVLWYISFMFQIDEFHNYFQMFDIHTITDTTDKYRWTISNDLITRFKWINIMWILRQIISRLWFIIFRICIHVWVTFVNRFSFFFF